MSAPVDTASDPVETVPAPVNAGVPPHSSNIIIYKNEPGLVESTTDLRMPVLPQPAFKADNTTIHSFSSRN